MRLLVDIPDDKIADSLIESADFDHSKLSDLILAIDLRVGDVGFTELIIKKLVKSVRSDYSTVGEFRCFIEELKK